MRFFFCTVLDPYSYDLVLKQKVALVIYNRCLQVPDDGNKYARWCRHNGIDMFIIDCIPSKYINNIIVGYASFLYFMYYVLLDRIYRKGATKTVQALQVCFFCETVECKYK
jgi:hypothetical protein